MKVINWIIAIATLAALGCWIYVKAFPNERRVIEKHLISLANTTSFDSGDGTIVRAAKASSLRDYFASEVLLDIDLGRRGGRARKTVDRAELIQMHMAIRESIKSLNTKFVDIQVEWVEGTGQATAHFTAIADVDGEPNYYVEEMRIKLVKEEDQWRITELQTIEPLH